MIVNDEKNKVQMLIINRTSVEVEASKFEFKAESDKNLASESRFSALSDAVRSCSAFVSTLQ